MIYRLLVEEPSPTSTKRRQNAGCSKKHIVAVGIHSHHLELAKEDCFSYFLHSTKMFILNFVQPNFNPDTANIRHDSQK